MSDSGNRTLDSRLSTLDSPSDRHPLDRLVRQLSFTDTTMLVIASVIGVGIFLTPGTVSHILPHPGLILTAWFVGGLLSLAGALANAELGAMYPHAGGDYVYVREAIHPVAGFLIGWLSFFAIYAGTVATLAVGFAEGLTYFVSLDAIGRTGVAIAVTVATSAINYLGVRLGARFNNIAGSAKIIALVGLAILGPLLGNAHLSNLTEVSQEATSVSLAAFGLALSPVLFSYLGWNAPVYVASEIREPGRTIPPALFLGLGICTAIYLSVNLAYLMALPMSALRGELRVGEVAARALFGPAGGSIAAVLILISIVSCLNATILVGPRIVYAMALDDLFHRAVRGVHTLYRTPHVAILVQGLTAIALILLLRNFPSVLDYTTFAIVLATMVDTAALYALRWRHPARPRPYRAWGYPIVPALYLLANGGIASAMLWGRPTECVVALTVVASGLPFYVAFTRRTARAGITRRQQPKNVRVDG